MRPLVRLPAVLGLVVLLLFAAAGTAAAGGPTSVIVTQPGKAATALYYNDAAYTELGELLDQGDEVAEPPLQDSAVGTSYNITWLIHDVSIWRVDHVWANGDETYVSTTVTDTGNAFDGTPTWRVAANPQRLLALLDGLFHAGAAAPAEAAAVPTPVPVQPASVRPTRSTETGWVALSGWRWSVPGVLLGVVLAAGWQLLRRRDDREPPRVLVDHEPERIGTR